VVFLLVFFRSLRCEIGEAENFVFENLQAGFESFCTHGSEAYGESITRVVKGWRDSADGQPRLSPHQGYEPSRRSSALSRAWCWVWSR